MCLASLSAPTPSPSSSSLSFRFRSLSSLVSLPQSLPDSFIKARPHRGSFLRVPSQEPRNQTLLTFSSAVPVLVPAFLNTAALDSFRFRKDQFIWLFKPLFLFFQGLNKHHLFRLLFILFETMNFKAVALAALFGLLCVSAPAPATAKELSSAHSRRSGAGGAIGHAAAAAAVARRSGSQPLKMVKARRSNCELT
jgi:hypothetical protein